MSMRRNIFWIEYIRRSFGYLPWRLLGGCRVDETSHCGYPISRKATPLRVFSNRRLIRGNVHAVDFVAGNVALQPLNLGPHSLNNRHRPSRDLLKFSVRQITRSRYFSLNQKLRHSVAPRTRMLTSLANRFKAGYHRSSKASYLSITWFGGRHGSQVSSKAIKRPLS